MQVKHIRLIGLFVVLALMAGAWSASAQDEGEIPQITIEATADGVPIPEEMPEGAVEITLTNNTEGSLGLIFLLLNEGVTADDVMAAVMEGGEEAVLELAALTGSVFADPGNTRDSLLILAPGNYMVFFESEAGGMGTFTVADGPGEGAAPPPADAEIQLQEFAFNAPLSVAAGPQVWHVENIGEQMHEIIVIPLPGDMTAAGFVETLAASLRGEEVEPQIDPIGLAFAGPGGQTWLNLDLEPGAYALLCFIPDSASDGHPHATKGMRQIIIATEAE